jgi:hypothetical protein
VHAPAYPVPAPSPRPPPRQAPSFAVADDTTTGIHLTDDDLYVTDAPTTPFAKKNMPMPAPPIQAPPVGARTESEAQPRTRIFSYQEAMASLDAEQRSSAEGIKDEATAYGVSPVEASRLPEAKRSNGSGLRLGRGSGVMGAVPQPAPSIDEAFDMLEAKPPKK